MSSYENWLDRVKVDYEKEILPVTENIVDRWGRMMARQTMPVIDSLIAATALEHGLTVATRNEADFIRSGVPLVNPFVKQECYGHPGE